MAGMLWLKWCGWNGVFGVGVARDDVINAGVARDDVINDGVARDDVINDGVARDNTIIHLIETRLQNTQLAQ